MSIETEDNVRYRGKGMRENGGNIERRYKIEFGRIRIAKYRVQIEVGIFEINICRCKNGVKYLKTGIIYDRC